MKKIAICFFIVAIGLSGCSSSSAPTCNLNQEGTPTEQVNSQFQYPEPFSLIQIETALTQAGLHLNDARVEGLTDFRVYNVTPAAYSVKASNHRLLVYVFKNIAERKKVLWFGEAVGLPTILSPLEGDRPGRAYAVGNVLIIDLLDAKLVPEYTHADEQVLSILQKVVRSLNSSQEVVFAAKGTHWDARYLVDYYQHWYKDDDGTTHVDQYSNGKWEIKYIGTDPESIHSTWYEYETPVSGGRGNGIFAKTDEDYYLKIGGDNLSNSIPDKNDVIALTIRWDGQVASPFLKGLEPISWDGSEESFKLKIAESAY